MQIRTILPEATEQARVLGFLRAITDDLFNPWSAAASLASLQCQLTAAG